jgi:protease IV
VNASLNSLPDQGPLLEVPVGVPGIHPATCKVAVIDIDGVLLNADTVGPFSMGENPVAVFQEKLNAAAADPAVKAVVLRVNSPGGSVAATEIMGQSLASFRQQTGKPVVACLLDQAAGGAYYLASSCDQIVAMPASIVGGIGVILNLYYLEVAMEYFNVFGTPIKAGDRIDMGSPARKMTAAEKAMFTAMAKEYHANYIQVVQRGRPQVKADAAIFDGRILSSSKALEEGLIDAVGFLPDALERARCLAKAEAVMPVMYRRQGSPARSLYDTVPNRPLQATGVSVNLPGLDRSKLPLFLYLWQVEPTLVRVSGG